MDRQHRADAELGPEQRAADQGEELEGFPDLATAVPGAFERQDYFDFDFDDKRRLETMNIEESDENSQLPEHSKATVRPARKPKGDFSGSDLVTASADVYARASNLLREAMGADGVVFINANKVPPLQRESFGADSDIATRRSEAEASDSGMEGVNMAELLAFSTREKGSIGGYSVGSYHFDLPELHFQRLLKRYPQGLVYHVDESGHVGFSSDEFTTGPSSNDDTKTVGQKRGTKDGQIFGRVAKDARTVAFYPLWDDSLERWRSAIFAWGTSGERCKFCLRRAKHPSKFAEDICRL